MAMGDNGGADASGLEQSFTAALRAATNAPDSDDAWDHLEELADTLQDPERVAALYVELLDGNLDAAVRDSLSQRAVRFHDEWFGEEPQTMQALLVKIIEADPEAHWAFERLTVVLTVAERWGELLGLYDRTLATTRSNERRGKLLDDAAHVAKDFADEPGRAVDYMQAQLELRPDNSKLAATIERLLGRQRRWEDLIELWQAQIPRLPVDEGRSRRVAIADVFLRHLEAPGPALDELRVLLDESPGHTDGCAQLERIVDFEDAPTEIRLGALGLLRTNYDAADRSGDLVTVLERAVQFAEGDDRATLHREAGVRLAILGRDEEAIAHYGQLLTDAPTDTDARKQLRQLARRSGLFTLRADALVAAADATTDDGARIALLLEAADLVSESIGDADRAIALYDRVVSLSEADPALALAAAHRLNELLASAGRSADRLAVLERLAGLERASAVRRAILGEAGRLAENLGDPDRALSAWQARLDADAADLEALEAMVALLDRNERWEPLVAALRRRSEHAPLPLQSRADLVRIAEVQRERLEATDEAIATWIVVGDRFGYDPEVIAALDGLMSSAARHAELAQIIDRAAQRGRLGSAALLSRMGDLHRNELSDPATAVRHYGEALGVDPSDATARAGLTALLDDDTTAAAAADALARAYRLTQDWAALLGLVDVRVAGADTPLTAVTVLREAARLHENQSADLPAAQQAIARALVHDCSDTALEHELLRLAELTRQYEPAADAFRNAVEQSGPSSARAAHLYRREGKLREQLDDHEAAARAYGSAAELDPESLITQRALIRVAASAGDWDAATRGWVRLSKARGVVDDEVQQRLVEVAGQTGRWSGLAAGLRAALEDIEVPPVLGRALFATCATWFHRECDDAEAAEDAAQRAVALDPEHRATLEHLAELQRRRPDAALVTTLLALDSLRGATLDPLHEAAQVAVDQQLDAADILRRLYDEASRHLTRGTALTGERDAASSTQWAKDHLLASHKERGDTQAAIGLLLDAAQRPLPADTGQRLRIEAAELHASAGAPNDALDLMLRVLAERPDDLSLVERAATLAEDQSRVFDLVWLRRRELTLTEDPARRLELRLSLSNLAGQLERQGGRVDALRDNLAQQPGHPASIDALVEVLSDRGGYAALTDTLTEQATTLDEAGHAQMAASLWGRVATLAEDQFGDRPRAIAALSRVAALAPEHRALDDLARLHLAEQQPAEAARWLEQRLATTDAAQQVAVRLRLARAQIQAERDAEAIATLRAAFDDAPRNAEVRKLLLGLYRKHEQWEPLAHALSVATEHVGDTNTILGYAREAAAIFHERLAQPEQAVPVLERAHALAPEDRKLRSMLAEGLRVAGRLDEASALLTALIADFGRRRSPQRAQAHVALAQVARAQGDTEQALDQLELASKMDASNPTIMRTLAQTAREAGQLDRAERAYRALLLQVRRAPSDGPTPVGAATVLVELSSIAAERGQQEQAEELVESALEALADDDGQAADLQASLAARGDHALLLRVLETRLANVSTDRQRAAVLGDLAQLREQSLGEPEAALDARLQALEYDPGSPTHHDRALDLAERLDALPRYGTVVESLLDRNRRNTDVHVRCELLLRLGASLERRGDFDRAHELLREAETTGVREVDVWRAAARLAGSRGDQDEQVRLLGRLAELGEDQAETRVDALFRIAEVHLSHAEGIDEGVETLRRALAAAPRAERAARILRRAAEAHEPHAELLELYEQVARQTDDPEILLHAIERRAAHPDTTPEQLREGVTLANNAEAPQRAEALMARAIELGEALLDGDERISWAQLGLAERRLDGGDLAGAVKWVATAAETAPLPELLELSQRIAAVALADDGDPSLAAKLYESLLERDPTERAAWEPLAGIYRKLGDVERLDRLVDETLDGLADMQERNALRLLLVEAMLPHAEHRPRAREMLDAIRMEDPGHEEATGLLVSLLEQSDDHAGLMDLLRELLLDAQGRQDAEGIASAALRLGQRLHAEDPAEAAMVYRGALDSAPRDPRLLHALLPYLDDEDSVGERAEILERLVELEQPDAAAELALRLSDLRTSQDDEQGALDALVRGYGRNPTHPALRQRLEGAYEVRGDFEGLAQLLQDAAANEEDIGTKTTLLRQVATIQRDRLGNAEAALASLDQARVMAPDDAELAAELVAALAEAGRSEQAAQLLGEQLEYAGEDDSRRLPLLVQRGSLREQAGDLDGAIEDFEQAAAVDATVAPRLADTIEQRRQVAAQAGDAEAERALTLRWVALAREAGRDDEARERIAEWSERERKDTEALQILRQLDTAAERWEAVSKTCARLVAIETGEAQAEAAVALAQASTAYGQPERAKAGLEHARRKQPDHPAIAETLASVYEAIGAWGELARLVTQQAEQAEDPDNKLELLRRACQLHIEAAETELALPLIHQVVQLAPDDLMSTVLLIDTHMAMGQLDEADEALGRAIESTGGRRSPELAALIHRKARICGARGNHAEQLELMQQAFSTDKNNGQVAAELAELAEALEEYDVAVKVLRTITVLDDCPISRVEAFVRQARIAHRRGDRQRAVLWARKARQEAPDSEDVLAFLAELGET